MRARSRSDRLDTVTRGGNAFAPTVRATAGPGEPPAIAEDKVAVRTARRLQDESPGLVPRDRFHRMHEMLFDLPFCNPQHLCQLVRREPGADQQVHDALTRGAFGREHRVMVGGQTLKLKKHL